MTSWSRRTLVITVACIAGVTISAALAAKGGACLSISQTSDGRISVEGETIRLTPAGHAALPVGEHTRYYVRIGTSVRIAGKDYRAGDRFLVSEGGELVQADWLQIARNELGYYLYR
jgi:hypothetical protein